MQVRGKKAAAPTRMAGGQPVQHTPSQSLTVPAPIRGWILNENLATVQPAGARVLDNWLCTTTGVRVRGGTALHCTLPDPVVSLFSFNSQIDKFFAATETGVFDISAPADPVVEMAETVTGQTSGEYSVVQFGTAGGDYLYAVNGTDAPLLFDGSTFVSVTGVSTPAITGVTTSALSAVWSFANRLFFIEAGSMNAWYLGVDSIGGAANSFSLAGVFRQGGSLLFGAVWSLDTGAGLDDKCVFVSTEGEIAVYAGTNPGSAADWSLQGLYSMPRPLGKTSFTQAGGDLLIATEIGLIPVSSALQTDVAAIEARAVSVAIAPYWQDRVRMLLGSWNVVKAPRRGVMFISQPDSAGATKTCLAVNVLTGAWSRCTGWDTQCLGYFDGNPYYGALDGKVYLMDVGGSDAGASYTAVMLGQFDHMGAYGRKKSIRQGRATFQASSPFNARLSALADYNNTLSAPPETVANYSSDVWDVGLWDVAIWDADSTPETRSNWVAMGATGATIAPELQLTFGVTPTPDIELVAIDLEFHLGAVVA